LIISLRHDQDLSSSTEARVRRASGSSDSVLPECRQIIRGCHPQGVFDFWLVQRQIDRPATMRTGNRVVRLDPAERLPKAMTAVWIAANQIEQPDIKKAYARRRYQ
jgi:hypothetical protein